jgi:hypothetical protein
VTIGLETISTLLRMTVKTDTKPDKKTGINTYPSVNI